MTVAFFALRPVYRQLRVAQLESAFTRREVLIERAEATERARNADASDTNTVTDHLSRGIFPFDDEPETDFNPEWAHSAEQEVGRLISTLSARLERKTEPAATDAPRAQLVEAARSMESCLADLHQWASVHFDDPDYNFADPKAEQEKANLARDEAAKVAGERLTAVASRARALDEAFAKSVSALRDRIRQTNERVLLSQ